MIAALLAMIVGARLPVLAIVIAGGLTLGLAVPITLGAAFAPSSRPLRDLASGTRRVEVGDYSATGKLLLIR